MTHFAVGLDLRDRRCVVVGGGSVAERRTGGLLASGARVTVVAPTLVPGLEARAAAGEIAVRRRPYVEGDLAGAFLAIAATDAPEVNAAVAAEARARGVLVNVADDPARGDFIVLATVRRGDLQIAISTGGRSPALARRVREDLERLLPPEYDQLLAVQAELRTELQQAGVTVAPEQWQAAPDAEVLALLRAGDRAAARARLRARLISPEARSLCS
ncbi:MAG: bifunctional precorrin-2 dehydrogenase/sirohydrochlorin ferrochelatase [Chloroflexi bacterium]|nr:bifunctional precorrin-2 dehydrogenase/sirohydrochlorin ferrochelatase [Chloroflexota bacterium]